MSTILEWLPVVGGVGGLFALLKPVIDFLRERPRLRVGVIEVCRGSTSNRELVFTVVNEGRRAAAVVDGGMAVDIEQLGRWPLCKRVVTAMYASPHDGVLPQRLEPSQPLRWAYRLGVDEPAGGLAFVMDSKGRYVWGARPAARLAVMRPVRSASRTARTIVAAARRRTRRDASISATSFEPVKARRDGVEPVG